MFSFYTARGMVLCIGLAVQRLSPLRKVRGKRSNPADRMDVQPSSPTGTTLYEPLVSTCGEDKSVPGPRSAGTIRSVGAQKCRPCGTGSGALPLSVG
jgi:hypothetical protein